MHSYKNGDIQKGEVGVMVKHNFGMLVSTCANFKHLAGNVKNRHFFPARKV